MKTPGRTLLLTIAAILVAASASAAPKAEKKPEPKSTKTTSAAPAKAPVSPTVVVPDVSADKSARVTMLDKQTNRKVVMVLMQNDPQTMGTLQVKLGKCLPDYQGNLGQDVAWLDITETADGASRTGPWFSGWMFNTYPEVSTLEHPRYDVQLQGCGTRARQIIQSTGSAPIVDSTPPEDTESTGDQPATGTDSSTDPYVVPGVKDQTAPATPAAEPEIQQTPPPAEEAPVAEPQQPTPPEPADDRDAQPQGDNNQDLHKLMDSGQY